MNKTKQIDNQKMLNNDLFDNIIKNIAITTKISKELGINLSNNIKGYEEIIGNKNNKNSNNSYSITTSNLAQNTSNSLSPFMSF
jgi:hypothetical protein